MPVIHSLRIQRKVSWIPAPLLALAMTFAIRCPQCQHEFVIAGARPGSAAVCPRCFHTLPIPLTGDSAPAPDSLDALEQIWSDVDTEQEAEPGDQPTEQASARIYGQPSQSRPAPSPEPGQPASAPPPNGDAYQDEGWKATLLGCVVPITILLGIIAFLAWYIISRTGSSFP